MSQITLDMLPPELQQLIQKALNGETGQRSPIAKPLTDLREPSDPKKRLHRPSFFFETGPDLKPYVHQEYPKVMWHQSGTDTLVLNRAAQDALGPDWSELPTGKTPDLASQVHAEMMDLTEEERQMVLDAHRDARLKSIQAKLAKMTDAELAALDVPTPKRKPGRPKAADGDHS